MSSDEEEPATPVLPKDSDRGSSVSSELQVAHLSLDTWSKRYSLVSFYRFYLQ